MSLTLNRSKPHLSLTVQSLKDELGNLYPELLLGVREIIDSDTHNSDILVEWSLENFIVMMVIQHGGDIFLHRMDEHSNDEEFIEIKKNSPIKDYQKIEQWLIGMWGENVLVRDNTRPFNVEDYQQINHSVGNLEDKDTNNDLLQDEVIRDISHILYNNEHENKAIPRPKQDKGSNVIYLGVGKRMEDEKNKKNSSHMAKIIPFNRKK